MFAFDLEIDVPRRVVDLLPMDLIVSEAQQAGTDLHASLYSSWPVKTGKSKRAWHIDLLPIGFTIVNEVRYTGFIKTGSPILQSNLRQTADNLSERLADLLPASMLKGLDDG